MENSTKSTHLIVFVSNFPFEFSEPYFETELPYLQAKFNKVTVVPADLSPKADRSKYFFKFPKGVALKFWDPPSADFLPLWKLLPGFLDFALIKEVFILLFLYKGVQRFSALKNCIRAWVIGQNYARFIQKEWINKGIDEKLYFYTFWCAEVALALAILKKKGAGQTMVSRIHAWDLYFERHKNRYLPFRSFIFNQLNEVFPISEKGKTYLKQHIPDFPVSKLSVAHLGTEPIINNLVYDKSTVIRLVTISKLLPIKRVGLLIEALSLLDGKIPILWHHLGGDLPEFQLLAEKKLKSIKYRFFALSNKETYYKHLSDHSYDLMVNLSENEGLPVSMMEAMSVKIPVLATNVGAVSEIVEEGKSGWLLEPNPAAERIARKIESLYKLDAAEWTFHRQMAFEKWNKHFNASVNYPAFCDFLLKL